MGSNNSNETIQLHPAFSGTLKTCASTPYSQTMNPALCIVQSPCCIEISRRILRLILAVLGRELLCVLNGSECSEQYARMGALLDVVLVLWPEPEDYDRGGHYRPLKTARIRAACWSNRTEQAHTCPVLAVATKVAAGTVMPPVRTAQASCAAAQLPPLTTHRCPR